MTRKRWTRREILTATGAAGLAALGASRAVARAEASRYEQAVLAKKPVAYWRLGEARGPDAVDATGAGHNGTYHGGIAFGERGAVNGGADTAVKFDGRNAYVEVADHRDFSQPTSGDGLTVEAWLRPDVLEFKGMTDDPYIYWMGKGEPKRQEWAMRFYSSKSKDRPNRISAYLFNPEGGLGAGAYFQDRLTAGEWIHVVACFDPGDATTRGAGVRIYKNGACRKEPPSAGTLYDNPKWQIRPAHGAAPLRLGTRDREKVLTGALDEVAVYPRVLTACEIREHYRIATGR